METIMQLLVVYLRCVLVRKCSLCARANLAKCLLYAINGGVDEISKKQIGPKYRPITSEYLDYDEVMDRYDDMMTWLAKVYVNAIEYYSLMHDKYCYEKNSDGITR